MTTFDPQSQEVQLNPYPYYEALRADGPVYRDQENNFWAVHRFADVWAAIQNTGAFSSAQGVALSGDEGEGEQDQDLPSVLLTTDPPKHTKLRKVVNRAFTPRRVASMQAAVEDLTISLLEPVVEEVSFDLVEHLAGPLPTFVIADLLGLPRDDYEQFRYWSEQMISAGVADNERRSVQLQTTAALFEYFAGIISERRRRPRSDLISALIEAQVDGEHLSEQELLGFCLLLLVAGNETTVNLIGNMTLALAHNVDQQAALREIPASQAVEEFLRFDSPVQALARTVTGDIELHGNTLHAGEKLLLLFGAANRDAQEFGDDANSLNVRRRIRRHLAFGTGAHYCLGASLARLEGAIACEQLMKALPLIALAGEPERLCSPAMRGLRHLPIFGRGRGLSA